MTNIELKRLVKLLSRFTIIKWKTQLKNMKMEQPIKVMNKKQIIDDAYKKYADSHWTPPSNPNGKLLSDQLFSVVPMEHSKESFINKCKTDPEFSEKWGLKIEERELSLKEQAHAYNNWLEKQNYNPKHQSKIIDIDKLSESDLMTILQSLPGPSKLITITYNNETIESYE
jgi:hypothetical protein